MMSGLFPDEPAPMHAPKANTIEARSCALRRTEG